MTDPILTGLYPGMSLVEEAARILSVVCTNRNVFNCFVECGVLVLVCNLLHTSVEQITTVWIFLSV